MTRIRIILFVNGQLDTALRQAGVSSDVATAASASVAELELRLNKLAGEVKVLKAVLLMALGVIWLLFIKNLG